MALFPCDAHGSMYRGAQQTIYPAIMNGIASQRQKRRLCPSCFDEVNEWCQVNLLSATSYGESMQGCIACEAEEVPYAIFVTLYARGEDRADYYGRACEVHKQTADYMLFGKQSLVDGV